MAGPLRRRTDFDASDAPPLRALIVEDDPNYALYVGTLVRRLGFQTTIVHDGDVAMAALETSAVDIAIVDCEMPRMGGLDLIRVLRTHPRGEEIYALMLTARQDIETKIAALRLGFDDFLVKATADVEIIAKLGAARRLIMRQRRLDAAVRELYGLATRDELTGLFNRRYFFAEAERMLSEGTKVNLVLFDLDDFKRVNDTMGHLAGDRILRDVGGLFLRRTRHDDLIARYGGDEFVLLAANAPLAEVNAVADRLAAEIATLQWTFGEETVRISVTTGIASSELLDQPSVARLLNAGDRDLYKSKWIRTHPEADPSLYEYDHAHGDHLSDLLEFPGIPRIEELKKQH